jgi:hypothetical protein
MEKLLTIAKFSSPHEADVVRLLLEERGFSVFVSGASAAMFAPAFGTVRLEVPESEAAQARAFVERFQESQRRSRAADETYDPPPVTFTCSECGQTISFPAHRRGGVEVCPLCRKYVDVPH